MILPTRLGLWVSLKIVHVLKIFVFLVYCAHAIVAPPVRKVMPYVVLVSSIAQVTKYNIFQIIYYVI